MVRLASANEQTPLATARSLSAQGLQVFPARFKDKIPLVKWKQFQDVDSSHMLEPWFKDRKNLNYWVMTGKGSGYAVIDCDSDEGEAWWRERIGAEMDATACVQTKKGKHYWFKLPEGEGFKSWSIHPEKDDDFLESWDVRGDDTGVIVPPSIHESGFQYTWVRSLDEALPLPEDLEYGGRYHREAPAGTGDASGTATGTGGQTRSMLSTLLSRPPGGDGTGRNDWLARVAGHYAKTYHNQEDLYLAHCQQANHSMGTPLDAGEFVKTVESIWRGEQERNDHRSIDADCGYLASGNTIMMCQVIVKRGEDKDYEFVEYADFDLHAKGVMTDEAGRRTYWAEIVRKRRGSPSDVERIDVILRAEVLGDDRALRRFLAGFACTVVPPDNMWPKVGSPGQRMQRYLESQQPPVVEIVPSLGFHPHAIADGVGGYVTHDGAITPAGLVPTEDVAVRADPRLRSGGTAPHDYGFQENEVIARQTLEEVLTFHAEDVTSVYGAWWAACLLKPQIQERTSLFPFVAIEAPSESGKTNGFFQMMIQLNGNTRGETQPTKAALRDMAASHRNGIVWVDDLDDPAYLMELLRAATSGGSLTKMGEDRESVKNTQIVSPIVISGEALGLGTQKALVDRAVVIKAGSPTARKSRHDDARPQWDDVLAVREQYPDGLHVIAGWFIQDALSVVAPTLVALRAGGAAGSGRSADKVAVLRAGARLLDYLVRQDGAWEGQGLHATRVEEWLSRHLVGADGIAVQSNENSLTLEVLPWAIRTWKFPNLVVAGEGLETDTPAIVKGVVFEESGEVAFDHEVTVSFNAALLAQSWEREKRGHHEKRTTTEAAFKDQAAAIGAKAKRVKVSNSGGRLSYYYSFSGTIAEAVVRRALGG